MGNVNGIVINTVRQAQAKVKPKTKKPEMFRVVLLNDDYTPMDFVVEVLQRFFGISTLLATEIMWEVHTKGLGICGVYPKRIAETKVAQVNDYARQHEHPLLCQSQGLDN